jgi:hypothetical protein
MNGNSLGVASRPDPEVVAKAKRRTYTAEYKQRIHAEAEAAAISCASRVRFGCLSSRICRTLATSPGANRFNTLLATFLPFRAAVVTVPFLRDLFVDIT